MAPVHIFVSYDLEHDGDLYARLLQESETESLGFEVSGRSEASAAGTPGSDALRRRIGQADQVIVICGEHTDVASGVFAELRMAQEERTPYFLLWGRRDCMCTKPAGAKSTEGMFSWTSQILQDQITLTTRSTHWEKTASAMKRPVKSTPLRDPATSSGTS